MEVPYCMEVPFSMAEWFKKEVPYRMTIGNGELMNVRFPKHLSMGTARIISFN